MILESNVNAVSQDLRVLLEDAHTLLIAAATLSGEKADEALVKGVKLVELALQQAQEAQASLISGRKLIVRTTNDYVHENPWCALSIAATAGVLAGFLCCRK